MLAIADEVDLLASIPRDALIAALTIAREQIDEGDEDVLPAYGVGIDTREDADSFVALLDAVLADLDA